MDLQNLAYALTQLAHNFGAVSVVALPLYALRAHPPSGRGLLWLILAGWAVQAASGAVFGAVSVYYYGQLPDIHGPAVAALRIKIACAIIALIMLILALRRLAGPTASASPGLWRGLAGLGVLALASAAVLRWYS